MAPKNQTRRYASPNQLSPELANSLTPKRVRMQALDKCLMILEDALESGRARVDGPLANKLRAQLTAGGLFPSHRLEGRHLTYVLDDIFELQGLCMFGIPGMGKIEVSSKGPGP